MKGQLKGQLRGAAILLLCFAAPAQAAPQLTGTWFGRGEPQDKEQMYLDHFLANGEIHSQFRTCLKGKAFDSNEDGSWAVSGDILTIKVLRRNGVPTFREDLYRLDLVTAQRFKEVYLPLNFPFDEHRVADNFHMPDCDLVS